jgi:hypothetical protein
VQLLSATPVPSPLQVAGALLLLDLANSPHPEVVPASVVLQMAAQALGGLPVEMGWLPVLDTSLHILALTHVGRQLAQPDAVHVAIRSLQCFSGERSLRASNSIPPVCIVSPLVGVVMIQDPLVPHLQTTVAPAYVLHPCFII